MVANSEQTVYVIEDDPFVRQSLVDLIRAAQISPRSFGRASEFLSEYEPGGRACLVLDVCLPDFDGLHVLRELAERDTDLPVVMISGAGDVPAAVESMRRGAFDFLQKPLSPPALLQRIQEALKENDRRRRLREHRQDMAGRFARLTERERDVVELVAQGLNNRQISERFGVSSQAVDAHRKRAMLKLGVSTVADLIKMHVEACEAKLVPPAAVPGDQVQPATHS